MKLRRRKKLVWVRMICDPSILNGYDNHVTQRYVTRWRGRR